MAGQRISGRAQRADAPLPPQPRLPRASLEARLTGMPPGSVAVIVSPPGYGATTLLSMAAEANPGPVVWLAGRGHARTAESLWRQLVAGLAATGATAPDVPTDPGADQEANHSAIHELLAAAGETAGCLLILDDLPREPLVEAMVQQSNRELAADLGISMNTLKTRLRRLYAKLGVHDRDAALHAARRRS